MRNSYLAQIPQKNASIQLREGLGMESHRRTLRQSNGIPETLQHRWKCSTGAKTLPPFSFSAWECADRMGSTRPQSDYAASCQTSNSSPMVTWHTLVDYWVTCHMDRIHIPQRNTEHDSPQKKSDEEWWEKENFKEVIQQIMPCSCSPLNTFLSFGQALLLLRLLRKNLKLGLQDWTINRWVMHNLCHAKRVFRIKIK